MPRPPPRSSSASSSRRARRGSRRAARRRGAPRPRSRRCRRSASRCASAGRAGRSEGSLRIRRDGLGGVAAGQREAELLVLVRGRDELVGVRLDADRDADQHVLRDAAALGQHAASRAISSKESTTTRPTPASSAALDLGGRLVVAVEARSARRGSRRAARRRARRRCRRPGPGPRRRSSATTAPRQERLAGVEHVGAGERLAPRVDARPEVGLVEHVGRGADRRREVAHVEAGELDDAVRRGAASRTATPPDRARSGRRAAGAGSSWVAGVGVSRSGLVARMRTVVPHRATELSQGDADTP